MSELYYQTVSYVLERSNEIMKITERIFANGLQSILGWLSGIATVLMPALPVIGTAFVFILVDLYYGYKVSKRFSGRKEFESRKFWSTVEKLGFAAVMICAFTFMDKYIFDTYETLTLSKIAAGTICFAELLSLLECLRALKPKSLIARLLTKVIKSKSEKYLNIDISDIINENITDDTNNK